MLKFGDYVKDEDGTVLRVIFSSIDRPCGLIDSNIQIYWIYSSDLILLSNYVDLERSYGDPTPQ